MSTVIEGAGRSEVFFIGLPADDCSTEVVVAGADERMDKVISAMQTRSLHRLLSMAGIFTQSPESEVERLSIARARTIYPVECPCHAGNQCQQEDL